MRLNYSFKNNNLNKKEEEASVLCDKAWHWKPARYDDLVSIQSKLSWGNLTKLYGSHLLQTHSHVQRLAI